MDFGNANDGQRDAITTTDGPVLITAGPGTGKTFTLVNRAIYLIQEKGVQPEEIMMATFTEKAAKELVTRITNKLAELNIPVNINEMYVGTFHSICLRILKEHLEFTRLKKNYRLLDQFDQPYTVYQHRADFEACSHYKDVFPDGKRRVWNDVKRICELVNKVSEELVSPQDLISDVEPDIKGLGEICQCYNQILEDENLIDFSTIQVECYNLLKEHPEILSEIQEKIKYLMIDEYQDTNYIQERLVFLLAGENQNICVVGDDDQGLYRFRGATIRNILEFPDKFTPDSCKIIGLSVNYRSRNDIVHFYNDWMQRTSGANFNFSWDGFRYAKNIVPRQQTPINSPTVVRLDANSLDDDWNDKILAFIHRLRDSGKLTDYNQIAFLFNSVKNDHVVSLARFLENNGINVYSPRSNMYFQREEIQFVVGCLLLIFPKYAEKMEKGEYYSLQTRHYDYYKACKQKAFQLLQKNADLRKWLVSRGKELMSLDNNMDYAFTGLFYQLISFEPFLSMLDEEMTSGVVDLRPSRNLAMFSNILSKFEYLYHITVFTKKYLRYNVEQFFNTYLRLLIDEGLDEYEDETEYAPSGCVSFLTIHQAKGMEFPIVIVGSLWSTPRAKNNDILDRVADKYYQRPSFEPPDAIKYFDFWRLYYTAFSRAQDLLVLTGGHASRNMAPAFKDIYNEQVSVDNPVFDLNVFEFSKVKESRLKETFSFTSHIAVYENCSRQYKFYKELGFTAVRESAMMFGTLVHETIEDIHRAAIRGEESSITEANIDKWFNTNYQSLVKRQHSYLDKIRQEAALRQVKRYVERQKGDWSQIREAEVEVSLVKPDYIIDGKIDLIKGENDTVELVDFKSEKKPDLALKNERLEHYRRQLHIYAYLIEQKTGHKVSKMNLYYTGEENSNPMVSFPYTETAVKGTMAAFDDTVHHILAKDYAHPATSMKTCENCDFRYRCAKK